MRKTGSPLSSQTMTACGSVSRARRKRIASALDSVTASAAARRPLDEDERLFDLSRVIGKGLCSEPVTEGEEPLLQCAYSSPASKRVRPGHEDDDRRRGDGDVEVARCEGRAHRSCADSGTPPALQLIRPGSDAATERY